MFIILLIYSYMYIIFFYFSFLLLQNCFLLWFLSWTVVKSFQNKRDGLTSIILYTLLEQIFNQTRILLFFFIWVVSCPSLIKFLLWFDNIVLFESSKKLILIFFHNSGITNTYSTEIYLILKIFEFEKNIFYFVTA